MALTNAHESPPENTESSRRSKTVELKTVLIPCVIFRYTIRSIWHIVSLLTMKLLTGIGILPSIKG